MRIQAAFCIAAFKKMTACFLKYFIFSYLSVWAMYFSCECDVWLEDISSCNYSEIRDEKRFKHVSMLPLAERVRTLCNARLQCLPYERENDFCFEYISHRNLTLNCNDKGDLEL